MRLQRALAVVLALSLMIGEAFRTWGSGRPVYAWIDDQIMGIALLVTAWLIARPTPARHAAFSAAWAFNAGMLYPSFFGKVFEPERSQPGNFDPQVLLVLIGIAFLTALLGSVWSILAIKGVTR